MTDRIAPRCLGVLFLLFASANCAHALDCPTPPPGVPKYPVNPPIVWEWDGTRFGDSLFTERPQFTAPGNYQDFECGVIGAFPRWHFDPDPKAPGPSLLSVHTRTTTFTGEREDYAIVEWRGATSFDRFDVIWAPDSKAPQGTVESVLNPGKTGAVKLKLQGPETYSIRLSGCATLLDCDLSLGEPLWIDIDPTILPPPSAPVYPLPLFPGELNVHEPDDGGRLTPNQRAELRRRVCMGSGLLSDSEGHEGELETLRTLAMLEAVVAESPATFTGCGTPTKPLDLAQIREEVRKAIMDAKVVSQVGTDLPSVVRFLAKFAPALVFAAVGAALGWLTGGLIPGGIAALVAGAIGLILGLLNADKAGDYDMRLQGILQIAYRYDGQLTPVEKCKILRDLLPVHGGADQIEEFLDLNILPSPILETENHLLMIQSARYLTNHLYTKWQPVCPGVKQPKDIDNDANGMTDWWLERLQLLMKHDFYEFSSRPYSELSLMAIRNLYDFAVIPQVGVCSHNKGSPPPAPFARRCDVRRAARNVLDYTAAKFATSSNGLRRAAPFRRHMDNKSYTRLWGRESDRFTAIHLAYAADAATLRMKAGHLNTGIVNTLYPASQSFYSPSYVITDLMSDLSKAPYGMGSAAPVQWLQRFKASGRGTATPEIYYRETDFLISAGGMFDGGVGMAIFKEDEDAWPLPTTLMPTAEGADLRDLIRIQGSWEQDSRYNLCVTNGFACGLNPIIPRGIPEACQERHGEWTFIDMDAKLPGCPLDYGFLVAVLRKACPGGDECDGDDEPDSDENRQDFLEQPAPTFSFGMFEAIAWPRPFASYVADVLAKNPAANFAWDKDNTYVSPLGRVVKFHLGDTEEKYPILSVDEPGVAKPIEIERHTGHWPLAAAQATLVGAEINTDEITAPGCVTVDNTRMGQRLILDLSDAKRPRRTRVLLPSECKCPIVDACLPSRLQ
jgi:hypothetical protein